MPTFGSLFAGIDGIGLGLEWAGWTPRWQVEIEPFPLGVLAGHWPDVPRYGDIRGVDWSTVEPVDLIAGGFPCQPVSVAGRRRGQSDDRWLWPEFARAVRALRPRYILVENVPGLLRPWADSDGCGLWHEAPVEEVIADLATLGYRWEYDSIPASAVGAPHERDRVWIVAHAGRGSVRPDGGHGQVGRADGTAQGEAREWQRGGTASGGGRALADADGGRRGERDAGERRLPLPDPRSDEPLADAAGERPQGPWQPLIPRNPAALGTRQAGEPLDGRLGTERGAEPGLGGSTHGFPHGLDHRWPAPPNQPQYEWEPPRVALGIPDRVPRLKALGNAVVPQIPELIGTWLLEAERTLT